MSHQISAKDFEAYELEQVLAASSADQKRLVVSLNIFSNEVKYTIFVKDEVIDGIVYFENAIAIYNFL